MQDKKQLNSCSINLQANRIGLTIESFRALLEAEQGLKSDRELVFKSFDFLDLIECLFNDLQKSIAEAEKNPCRLTTHKGRNE